MSEHVPSDWYADFFTELPNEFRRRAVPPEATASEVDFIESRLGLQPRSRIIDVPCGSGRHTLALAARRHRMVGVDISTEAIDHARRAVADADLDVDRGRAAAESVLPGYASGQPRTMDTGDIAVEATNEYDVAGSRLFSRYQFTRGAEDVRVTAIHHVYTSAHLGWLLTARRAEHQSLCTVNSPACPA